MSDEKVTPPPRSGSASRDLRRRAEALLAKPGSEIPSIPGEDIKALVHELQVHQVELEIQNEELREAQLELGKAHERYSDLYEFAPVSYLTLDAEGVILESNLTAVTALGVARGKLIGAKLSDFVTRSAQDDLYLFRRKIASSNLIQTCELEMRRADGSVRDMQLEGLAVNGASAESAHCRLALIDVTDEKKARAWQELALQMVKMVEQLPAGAVYVDQDSIKINQATEKITGYAKEELTTLDQWFRKLHGSRHGEMRKRYEALYKEGLLDSDTGMLIRKNGEKRIVEFAGHRFDDHAVWILQDVTEREEAVDALRKSEQRNRSILNAAVDAIIMIDKHGIIAGVNPATERTFGYAEKELIGQNVSIVMPVPNREEPDDCLARDPGTDEPHGNGNGNGREVMGRRKDGSTFPADVAVSEADAQGNRTSIIRDITRRKQAQNALRLQHELNENLIETTQSIILVLDVDGRIVRFNSAFEKITGWSSEQARGRDWFETFLPKRDRKRARKLFHREKRGTPTSGDVNAILTKAGEERQIEWHDARLYGSDGSLTGLICSGMDVTESRELEQQVFRAAEEEKIRISVDLHDELGSMLTGISFLASTLSGKIHRGEPVEGDDADKIVEYVRQAISQTRALAKGLHRIGDAPGALPTALSSLVKRVTETSDLSCRFVNQDSDLTFKDTPVGNHLYRIAQEAVNNAIRHSDATHLTIQLKELGKGRHLLSIKDNGCGFDPDDFTGADNLGLRIMAYRARSIGAQLTVAPRRQQGTKVVCNFTID